MTSWPSEVAVNPPASLSGTGVPSWVPGSCTLPTAAQPMRVADVDDLFSQANRVERTSTGVRVELPADAALAARAADLAVRESQCCSFFTFTLTVTGTSVSLEVTAPAEHGDVLDALADRASSPA